MFENEILYWERRLYASVFLGQINGDEWYQTKVPAILARYRQLGSVSKRWKFFSEYYDAQYALNLGQYSRAIRSAKQALALRPEHRGAAGVLRAAEEAKEKN